MEVRAYETQIFVEMMFAYDKKLHQTKRKYLMTLTLKESLKTSLPLEKANQILLVKRSYIGCNQLEF